MAENMLKIQSDNTGSLIKRKLYRWLPPLVWMGLIFFTSSQSGLPSPTKPDTLADALLWKTAHVVEYGILMGLLWRAFDNGEVSWTTPFVCSFIVSVLFAASDEYHQIFVPGREGKLVDVGIDSLGILLASGALWWLRKRSEQRRES